MNKVINLGLIASASLLVFLSSNSFAEADGAKLYKDKLCHTCHGEDGNTPSVATYPKIAGQTEAYTLEQLKDFKSGARSNGQAAVMKAMLASVTEDDMKVLAAYIAGLPAK